MEKPILFNTEMVMAILDRRKTMTRRIVKPQPKFESGFDYPHEDELGIYWKSENSYVGIDELIEDLVERCPYGQPGDILWVRETWKYYEKAVGYAENFHVDKFLAYKADQDNNNIQKSSEWFEGKWHPSIHMPRAVARLSLKVTNVRVETLHDITEEDARAEGCIDYHDKIGDGKFEDVVEFDLTARDAFAELWDSTIKKKDLYKYGWDANPWVFVIEFERVEVQS